EPIGRRRLLGWVGATGAAGLVAGAAGDRYIGAGETPAVAEDSPRLRAADRTAPAKAGGLPMGLARPVPAFGHLLAIDLTDHARRSPKRSRETARTLLQSWTQLAREGDATGAGDDAAAGFDIRPASLQVTPGIGASLLDRKSVV